jgi:hypothetical protein
MTDDEEIETRICEKAVDGLLAAGFAVGVTDGEEATVTNSTDKTKIMDAVSATGEAFLLAYKNGKKAGWVRLMWGNAAHLIIDYTVNLEDALKEANAFAASYATARTRLGVLRKG